MAVLLIVLKACCVCSGYSVCMGLLGLGSILVLTVLSAISITVMSSTYLATYTDRRLSSKLFRTTLWSNTPSTEPCTAPPVAGLGVDKKRAYLD